MNPYLARLRALSPETQHPGVTGKPTKPPALVESERALIAAEHSSAHENRHHEELTKPTKPSFVSLVSDQGMRISKFEGPVAGAHYAHLLSALNEARPAFVEHDRWRQAVVDAKRFLAKWGEVAQQLGWTGKELFGLHRVPERPSGSYSRLSRYDETGLIWLLRGRYVIVLTDTTAVIQGSVARSTYYKINKPALGPLGDSLDDIGAFI